ncbi:MAG: YaeQ family protein [Arenimonas sp.]
MAVKATIFKAELQVSDMDRNYYQSHALTLAQHPSETEERLMVRLLAFALNASEGLAFGRGLSTDDEPDLWQRDLTGQIELWIEVGQPDEQRIRKACGRSSEVRVYCFSGRSAEIWWKKNAAALDRCANLRVFEVPVEASQQLAALASRSMRLQCLVQDGQVQVMDEASNVAIEINTLK